MVIRSKLSQNIKLLDYFNRTLFLKLKKSIFKLAFTEFYPRIERSAEQILGTTGVAEYSHCSDRHRNLWVAFAHPKNVNILAYLEDMWSKCDNAT
jgi:hypothetical protein